MPDRPEILQQWTARLQALGLDQAVAALLEATGPLNLLGAQLVYIGQPLLRGWLAEDGLTTLAAVLEDPQYTRAFVQSLRTESR